MGRCRGHGAGGGRASRARGVRVQRRVEPKRRAPREWWAGQGDPCVGRGLTGRCQGARGAREHGVLPVLLARRRDARVGERGHERAPLGRRGRRGAAGGGAAGSPRLRQLPLLQPRRGAARHGLSGEGHQSMGPHGGRRPPGRGDGGDGPDPDLVRGCEQEWQVPGDGEREQHDQGLRHRQGRAAGCAAGAPGARDVRGVEPCREVWGGAHARVGQLRPDHPPVAEHRTPS
mmetsp:Transcript_14378/g.35135  ORF Transcript_14378/g.35135 Transcript_14378/m.35135 type:complete len:231 (+) Transcript_14378:266-958(+)